MNMPMWFSNLASWSAQVALLVLVGGFLPRIFQIRQPRVLLIYWRALLAISLVLPFAQPWHRAQNISVVNFAPEIVTGIPVSAPAVPHWHFPGGQFIAEIAAIAILAGVAVRFAILALGLLKLRRLRQESRSLSAPSEAASVVEEVHARVTARAELRLSAEVDSPVTFGFAAPVILLPERFSAMDSRFQAAIACHELLHVRRHDWAHHLAEEIVRAVFWFHPAIAWLIARLRLAREQVVDLEVLRLTKARKTYLEALLEFTAGRAPGAAVPAPPFLAERQLAERVALMLKEVRMSRTRLVASLTSIVCLLALTVALAVWAFPLRAGSSSAQSAPESAVQGGVSGGVTGGVSGSVSGGVAGGVAAGIAGGISSTVSGGPTRDIPTVDKTTIWTDKVKRGPMVRQVRGLGSLVRSDSGNLMARITLPEFMMKEVEPGQNLTLSTPKWSVKGHVRGLSRKISNGEGTVDLGLEEITLPEGAGA